MTNQRIWELDRMASSAIAECRRYGKRADCASLAFWRGVKMVVDELKREENRLSTLTDDSAR